MEWTVAIGVDTHKDVHVAVALDALGGQLDSQEIPTIPAGYRPLLSWAQELGVPAFAIEGTGSYGAGLVRFLTGAEVVVYECERPRRQDRRPRGLQRRRWRRLRARSAQPLRNRRSRPCRDAARPPRRS
jgi:transposase